MAQAQFISDGQADFFQNVLSYAFLNECQRMEPESAQQRLDRENRPWGPEAAEAEYYSVWVELWTVVESDFEQLFSLLRSWFLFHHFPPTSFYSIIITLYWAILGSDGMCDSCRSTRGKLGSSELQDCVWTPFVNWLLLSVVSSASILIHDRSWLHAHRFNKFAAAGAISSASNIDAFSLKLSHAVFAHFWAFIARCFVVYF